MILGANVCLHGVIGATWLLSNFRSVQRNIFCVTTDKTQFWNILWPDTFVHSTLQQCVNLILSVKAYFVQKLIQLVYYAYYIISSFSQN